MFVFFNGMSVASGNCPVPLTKTGFTTILHQHATPYLTVSCFQAKFKLTIINARICPSWEYLVALVHGWLPAITHMCQWMRTNLAASSKTTAPVGIFTVKWQIWKRVKLDLLDLYTDTSRQRWPSVIATDSFLPVRFSNLQIRCGTASRLGSILTRLSRILNFFPQGNITYPRKKSTKISKSCTTVQHYFLTRKSYHERSKWKSIHKKSYVVGIVQWPMSWKEGTQLGSLGIISTAREDEEPQWLEKWAGNYYSHELLYDQTFVEDFQQRRGLTTF